MATEEKVIVETVEVDAPVEEVYAKWNDLESFPDFMSGVNKVEKVTHNLTRWDVSIAGIKHHFDAEITEQIPDYKMAWRTLDEWVHTGEVLFERVSDTVTEVTVRVSWQPENMIEKLGAALHLDGSQVATILKQFKKHVEKPTTVHEAKHAN